MSGEECVPDLEKEEKTINLQADELNFNLKSVKCLIPVI